MEEIRFVLYVTNGKTKSLHANVTIYNSLNIQDYFSLFSQFI